MASLIRLLKGDLPPMFFHIVNARHGGAFEALTRDYLALDPMAREIYLKRAMEGLPADFRAYWLIWLRMVAAG
jgi:hypothetical protein